MELHVDDDGFVRAPAGLVYARLTDLGAWPGFWPGTSTRRVGSEPEAWALRAHPGGLRPRLSLQVEPHAWRHDAGFRMRLDGDVRGEAEFWLEPGWGGTVVHHLAHLHLDGRRARAVGVAYRAWLRAGLCGLKDQLQVEVRERLGLVP